MRGELAAALRQVRGGGERGAAPPQPFPALRQGLTLPGRPLPELSVPGGKKRAAGKSGMLGGRLPPGRGEPRNVPRSDVPCPALPLAAPPGPALRGGHARAARSR